MSIIPPTSSELKKKRGAFHKVCKPTASGILASGGTEIFGDRRRFGFHHGLSIQLAQDALVAESRFPGQNPRMQAPYSNIPELYPAAGHSGVIRIPVEQDVPFTPRVRAIVDTPQFQRLRSVTQLALASQVYPGANHTRFEHALGVYHNSLLYLRQLARDPRFTELISDHDAEVLIAAALLHDIGHWPFCHPIEDLGLKQLPPHETYARQFIGAGTELADVLRTEWKINPDEILQILTARTDDPKCRLQQAILSGPIDIDKMDYLVRDSQHCGVPYGRQFDRNRLISCLIVNEAGDGLAISSKGRTAAEMMVFARYVMFSEVYWHHAVRSATVMFARSFYELLPQLDITRLFQMTEPDLTRRLLTTAQNTPVQLLAEGVFGARRSLFKRVAEYSLFHEEDLYRSLRQKSWDDLVGLSNRVGARLAAAAGVSFVPLSLLIDAPPQHREVEFRIDVFSESELQFRPLREVSPIVDSMARTQFDDCVKRVRLFAEPEFRDTLRKRLSPAAIDEILRSEAGGQPARTH